MINALSKLEENGVSVLGNLKLKLLAEFAPEIACVLQPQPVRFLIYDMSIWQLGVNEGSHLLKNTVTK